MRKLEFFCLFAVLMVSPFLLGGCSKSGGADPKSFVPEQMEVRGDLANRIAGNMDYIEEQAFWPKNIFAESDSSGWPGNLEGRLLLAWVSDGRAIKRNPIYAEPMVERLSERLNNRGYLGPVYEGGVLNEQQIAGNSWMLRGLCAYYASAVNEASKEKTKGYIRSIVDNLFLANKGAFKDYPVERVFSDSLASPETGIIVGTEGKWMLSSDVGCVFVALDGLSDAYSVLQDPAIKEVFNEMATRFLAMNIMKVRAHTHSSLTAMRGLLRYASLTGERQYVADVQRLWVAFSKTGMSESYGVFNWFGRFDTWSDPNAIVDAYMLSTQLWSMTRNIHYLEDAELIFVNAFALAQRPSGGFGSQNNADRYSPFVTNHTMETLEGSLRGAEGLSAAVTYGYFAKDDTLFVPFLGSADATFAIGGGLVTIKQETGYPLKSSSYFSILGKTSREFVLLLPIRPWNSSFKLKINGVFTDAPIRAGFMEVSDIKNGDNIEFSFQQEMAVRNPVSMERTLPGQFRLMYGPMLVCYNLPYTLILTRESKIIPTSPGFFDIEGTELEMISVFSTYSNGNYDPYAPAKKILF